MYSKTTNFSQFLPFSCNFYSKSTHFLQFLHFFTIFSRNLLAYFTQALQTNPSNPIFTRKTNIAPEEINRKSLIFPKSG